jgi:translation initiation factor 3 subunit A
MFLVSKNYLFHAYAWLKLYNLEDKSTEDSGESLNSMASCLILAALAVPIFSKGDGVSEYDDVETHKHKEMAALLGYHFSPQRSSLMEQLVSMNLLEICPPQIQQLFDILENGKRPMSMVKDVVPLIKWLRENEQFSKYADGIDALLVVRSLEQLAKVSKTTPRPPLIFAGCLSTE